MGKFLRKRPCFSRKGRRMIPLILRPFLCPAAVSIGGPFLGERRCQWAALSPPDSAERFSPCLAMGPKELPDPYKEQGPISIQHPRGAGQANGPSSPCGGVSFYHIVLSSGSTG